jgi:proteasome lid subunit RPN8/RPN11
MLCEHTHSRTVRVLNMPKRFVDRMVAHARAEAPNECCGLLAGRDERVLKLYRIASSQRSPMRYYMEPQELYNALREIDDNGLETLAVYHSHPAGRAYPSATDVELSWPDYTYIIISLVEAENPDVAAFRIADGKITQVGLRIGR